MSHNIQLSTYPENVDKKKVQHEWDEYAAQVDWQEGCSGLPNQIRWLSPVLDDYEAAKQFIESSDKGWYDQLAVRYKEYPEPKPTKKLSELKTRRDEAIRKYCELQRAFHFENIKAEFVSCRNCKSKISRKFLKSNFCPVCKGDMRPVSTLERIAQMDAKKKSLSKEYLDLKDSEAKKLKPTIKWLVKIEYHT